VPTACPRTRSPAPSPAGLDGLSIEEYCTNPRKAVKAMINYYERYEPDIMIAFNDLAKKAEAVGWWPSATWT
jgi:uroporphyrinogen-III decarboxylase